MAPMRYVFIGMSGVGKSYWACQLSKLRMTPFAHFDCDTMIAERLGEIIEIREDEDPVHAVGRWMGMPWSQGYEHREKTYLALEREVTALALYQARAHSPNTVVDTTGSVIYTGKDLLARLKKGSEVIYFDAPDDVRQQMVELYLREPKPVLWQGGYQPNADELGAHALERCYAELLQNRAEQYRALADVVIDYHAVRQPGFGVDDLLKMIAG